MVQIQRRTHVSELILCPSSSSGGKNLQTFISLSMWFYPQNSKRLDHSETEFESIWNKQNLTYFAILKNSEQKSPVNIFLPKYLCCNKHFPMTLMELVLQQVLMNVGSTILSLSMTLKQFISPQNDNLMVGYFLIAGNIVIIITFFSWSSGMALCLRFPSIKIQWYLLYTLQSCCSTITLKTVVLHSVSPHMDYK